MDVAVRSGVAPAMDLVELNAVAMLLQNFQSQILRNGVGTLTINSREHQKHAGTNTRSRRFVFEKSVQMLGDIRLLRRSEGTGDINFSRLFTGEKWERSGQHYLIKMTPARLGPEIIFGVSDPHIDLARGSSGEPEGRSVTGETAPLSLSRSAWLDLQGIEQGVYLRMEMAMQWFRNLLQIDGIWGCSFAELLKDFRLPSPRSAREVTETEKMLRLLEKLGRKLQQHGVLSLVDDEQYLAFDMANASQQPSLVWQVSRERHLDAPRSAYLKEVARWMEVDRATDFAPKIARICLPRTVSAEKLQSADALWNAIKHADVDRQYVAGLENAASQPILPSLLFYELCLRSTRNDELAIPEEYYTGILRDIVDGVTAVNAAEAFTRFSNFLSDSYDFTNAVRSVPMISLAARITRESKNFVKLLRDVAKPTPEESVIISVPVAEQPAPPSEQFAGNQIRRAAGEREVPPKKAAISEAVASRMLRTASEELGRIRDTNPERYQQLKKSYLSSLDEAGRKLFLDFQRRMQPSIFEDHIKQKLIRYMVENPGSWSR